MKTFNIKYYILFLYPALIFAQVNTYSPYSFFGIGNLESTSFSQQSSMGGLSNSFFENNQFSNTLPFLDFSNFSFLSKITLIIWTVFITVGIWRSAENYKGNIIWIIATFLFLSYRIFSLRLIFFT